MSDIVSDKLVDVKRFLGTSVIVSCGVSSYPISEMSSGSLTPVDKESYRPSSVTTRNQLLSPSGVVSTGVYDFNDGKDTGVRPVRRLDLDRVQVDQIVKEKLDNAEKLAQSAEAESLAKVQAQKDAEAAKQARIAEAVETSRAVSKSSKSD